jgi:hypothetical protein
VGAVGALAALGTLGCAQPPADGAQRRATARAALEAAVGPFPTLPAGGTAGLRLREATQAVALDEGERPLFRRLSNSPTAGWSVTDRFSLTQALAARAAALDELRAAASALPDGLALPVPVPEDAFPDLRPLLDSSRVLVLDGREALAGGDTPRAAADARALGGLLRAGYLEPWVITQLLGNAAERNAGGLVADALAGSDPAVSEELRVAFRRLQEIPVKGWLAGEASLAGRALGRRSGEREMRDIAGFEAAYGDLVVARIYERYGETATLLEGGWADLGPWAEAQERAAEERRSKMTAGGWLRLALSPSQRVEQVTGLAADLLWGSQLDVVKKSFATRSMRGLAIVALDLAHERHLGGPLPTAVPAGFRNDYTGEQPVFETRADGTIHLALPLTAAAWRRDFPADVVEPRLEWDVPAPRDQSANTSPGPAASRPRS